jgi:hypothetical protein
MRKICGYVLVIIFLSVMKAPASDSVNLNSIGATGGILLPQGNWNNGFSAEIQSDMGEIIKYIFLIPHIGYWHTSRNETDQDLSYSNFYFGTKFIGYINSKPRGFFAGIGIQYHIINQEEIDTGFDTTKPAVKNRQFEKLGFSILAGYRLKLKRISFSFEPKYTIIPGGDNMTTISLGASYLFQ